MNKKQISGWYYMYLKENWSDGLKLRDKFIKWKKDAMNDPDYHDKDSGCMFGLPDGPDDSITECECSNGWWK